jgi:aminoglycoside phosphotransferase (APT) family kinase protein
MKSHITINDDFVMKTAEPAALRVEVEKTVKAREVARRCGLFTVPMVLEFDKTAGRAKFEYIPNLHSIREVIVSEAGSKPLMRRIGACLAIIHKDLMLPEEMKLPLPREYQDRHSEVFIHGDFGLANVKINPEGSHIVIIDWQTPSHLGTSATYGTRFFDLTWFIYDLFYRPVGRERYKMAVPAAPMAREFLDGYFEASGYRCDPVVIKEYMKSFINVKKAVRKQGHHWKRRLQLIPSHLRLRKFINSADLNCGLPV